MAKAYYVKNNNNLKQDLNIQLHRCNSCWKKFNGIRMVTCFHNWSNKLCMQMYSRQENNKQKERKKNKKQRLVYLFKGEMNQRRLYWNRNLKKICTLQFFTHFFIPFVRNQCLKDIKTWYMCCCYVAIILYQMYTSGFMYTLLHYINKAGTVGGVEKNTKYFIFSHICDKPTFFCFSLVKRELMWLRPAGAWIPSKTEQPNETYRWKYLHIFHVFKPACTFGSVPP